MKGSSVLYEVKIVDFVKVENKESKFPGAEFFVV